MILAFISHGPTFGPYPDVSTNGILNNSFKTLELLFDAVSFSFSNLNLFGLFGFLIMFILIFRIVKNYVLK